MRNRTYLLNPRTGACLTVKDTKKLYPGVSEEELLKQTWLIKLTSYHAAQLRKQRKGKNHE